MDTIALCIAGMGKYTASCKSLAVIDNEAYIDAAGSSLALAVIIVVMSGDPRMMNDE